MEDIKYEKLMGILSEIKKGVSVIQMNNKLSPLTSSTPSGQPLSSVPAGQPSSDR